MDFEYRRSHERIMDLVCCATREIRDDGTELPARTWWLHDDCRLKQSLSAYLQSLQTSHIMMCFNASAEGRSFISLGLDPRKFRWIDVHLEWKIATNNHLDYMYGKISKGNGRYVTSRPLTDKTPGVSHEKVGTGLSAMVLALLDVDIDTEHKDIMRRLILSGRFTAHDRLQIMEYCASDTRHIYSCLRKMPQFTFPEFLQDAMERGRWAVNLACIEATGIPLDMDRVFSFAASFDAIRHELITECNKAYPFFVWTKKTKSRHEWVQSYAAFLTFVSNRGMLSTWPRTKPTRAGVGQQVKLCRDEETLKAYRGIPEINTLRDTLTILQQAKWYRPAALPDFLERVGSDCRLRPYFNALGTATGRNAPPSKTFIFAQSAWTRSMISPPPGWAISGIDYSSQEFAVAAALSNDHAMIDAYNSGDPYLSFAKKAGAIPQSATRETHGAQRDLFKACVLACQYGMGAESLALSIAANTGKQPDVDQAMDLLNMHREVFWVYYEWLEKVELEFRRKGYLRLHNGHTLWLSNDLEKNILSFRNHPVQGTGAVILSYAVDAALDAGIKVISPLHDAIYHEHLITDTEESNAVLRECMDRAVFRVFGDRIRIRNDVKTIKHGETWIEPKAEKTYGLMKKFLDNDDGVFLRMSLFDERN